MYMSKWNSMHFIIEHLRLYDLAAFLREQADDIFFELKDENRLNMLADKWSHYAEFCTCRDDNGHLVGMIVFYANRLEGQVAYIPHVYVKKEYRRKGIYGSLFRGMVGYVKQKGYNKIRLEVEKDNTIAIMTYCHYGFSIIGECKRYSYYMECFV